ncbi:hypothetical protein RGQ29_026953, partial [Quercus rubra]
ILSKNYLSRILDAKIHLEVMNLGNTLMDGNQAFQQDHAKAMIFIRHHLHEELKTKYLTKKITNEDMLEKTCIMFHVLFVGENIYHISYQYHEYKFIKYPELIYFLRVVEQNNELSLKNHQSHLTHSTPFPKAN